MTSITKNNSNIIYYVIELTPITVIVTVVCKHGLVKSRKSLHTHKKNTEIFTSFSQQVYCGSA